MAWLLLLKCVHNLTVISAGISPYKYYTILCAQSHCGFCRNFPLYILSWVHNLIVASISFKATKQHLFLLPSISTINTGKRERSAVASLMCQKTSILSRKWRDLLHVLYLFTYLCYIHTYIHTKSYI